MEMHCHNMDLSCAEHDLQLQDLNFVYSWLCINLLSLSIKKSNVMSIGSFKYLGLLIDENLTWREHTTSVLQRVLSRMHWLYRLNPIPKDLLGKLYI